MGVHIANLALVDAGHSKGVAHGHLGTGPIGRARREVVCVRRGAIACNHSKRRSAASKRMAELFNDQHRSAFGKNKTVMAFVEWPRRLVRSIAVACCQSARRSKATNRNWINRTLCPTDDGNFCFTGHDKAHAIADRLGRCCAGRDRRPDWATKPMQNGEPACCKVCQKGRNGEGRQATRAFDLDRLNGARHNWRAANARPDHCSRRRLILGRGGVPPRLIERFACCADGILNEQVHLLDLFAVNEVGRIKAVCLLLLARHQARNMADEIRRIEAVVVHDAATPLHQPLPKRIHSNAQRADSTHSGDNDGICGIRLQHMNSFGHGSGTRRDGAMRRQLARPLAVCCLSGLFCQCYRARRTG